MFRLGKGRVISACRMKLMIKFIFAVCVRIIIKKKVIRLQQLKNYSQNFKVLISLRNLYFLCLMRSVILLNIYTKRINEDYSTYIVREIDYVYTDGHQNICYLIVVTLSCAIWLLFMVWLTYKPMWG